MCVTLVWGATCVHVFTVCRTPRLRAVGQIAIHHYKWVERHIVAHSIIQLRVHRGREHICKSAFPGLRVFWLGDILPVGHDSVNHHLLVGIDEVSEHGDVYWKQGSVNDWIEGAHQKEALLAIAASVSVLFKRLLCSLAVQIFDCIEHIVIRVAIFKQVVTYQVCISTQNHPLLVIICMSEVLFRRGKRL